MDTKSQTKLLRIFSIESLEDALDKLGQINGDVLQAGRKLKAWAPKENKNADYNDVHGDRLEAVWTQFGGRPSRSTRWKLIAVVLVGILS